MPTKTELSALREKSFKNQEKVLQVEECCCFDCTKFFASSEVVGWIDDGDQKTAMCPYCGFDTVLPNDPNNPISKELLKEMQAAYVGDGGGNDATVNQDFVTLMNVWDRSQS